MTVPEFIYLNEQAVRVTSWNRDSDTGTIDVVVIARGDADRDQLLDVFDRDPVMVRIGNGSAIPMEVRSLETRTTGEGSRIIHRLQVSLAPEGLLAASTPPPPRGTSTDQRLDQIIELLTEIRDELRQIRQ